MAPSPTNPTLFALGIRGFRKPSKTFFGSAFRPIFASDPSVVMKRVDEMEQIREIHFAGVRLGSIWNSRQLKVPDFGKEFLRAPRQVAAHDLGVIPVKLNFQFGMRKLL